MNGRTVGLGVLTSEESTVSDNSSEEDLLIRTRPSWYLPNVSRGAASRLLYNKDAGNFIVRQSSQSNEHCLSVRLQQQQLLPKKKHERAVHHFIIRRCPTGLYKIEGSAKLFSSIHLLITYYCKDADVLPTKLRLSAGTAPATYNSHTLALTDAPQPGCRFLSCANKQPSQGALPLTSKLLPLPQQSPHSASALGCCLQTCSSDELLNSHVQSYMRPAELEKVSLLSACTPPAEWTQRKKQERGCITMAACTTGLACSGVTDGSCTSRTVADADCSNAQPAVLSFKSQLPHFVDAAQCLSSKRTCNKSPVTVDTTALSGAAPGVVGSTIDSLINLPLLSSDNELSFSGATSACIEENKESLDYFSSKLSDRLSDYEDVWDSSSEGESMAANEQVLHPHLRKDVGQSAAHSALSSGLKPVVNSCLLTPSPLSQIVVETGSEAMASPAFDHVTRQRRDRVGSVPLIAVQKLLVGVPAERRLSLGTVRSSVRAKSFGNGSSALSPKSKLSAILSRKPQQQLHQANFSRVFCDIIRAKTKVIVEQKVSSDSLVEKHAYSTDYYAPCESEDEVNDCLWQNCMVTNTATNQEVNTLSASGDSFGTSKRGNRTPPPPIETVPTTMFAEIAQSMIADRDSGAVESDTALDKCDARIQEAKILAEAKLSTGSVVRTTSFQEKATVQDLHLPPKPNTLPIQLLRRADSRVIVDQPNSDSQEQSAAAGQFIVNSCAECPSVINSGATSKSAISCGATATSCSGVNFDAATHLCSCGAAGHSFVNSVEAGHSTINLNTSMNGELDDSPKSHCPKFPLHFRLSSSSSDSSLSTSDCVTLQDVIVTNSPGCIVPPICALTSCNLQRLSIYDNVPPVSMMRFSVVSGSTVFSKPWDAGQLEEMLHSASLRRCLDRAYSFSQESDGIQMHTLEEHCSLPSEDELEAFDPNFSSNLLGACPVPRDSSECSCQPCMSWMSAAVPAQPPPGFLTLEGQPCQATQLGQDDSCVRSSKYCRSIEFNRDVLSAQGSSTCPRPIGTEEADSGTELDSSMDNIYTKNIPDVAMNATADNSQVPRQRRPSAAAIMCNDSQASLQDFSQRVKQMRSPKLSSLESPTEAVEAVTSPLTPTTVSSMLQPGVSIRACVRQMAFDKTTLFGDSVDHFIQCTRESSEMNPHTVLSNVRQFMTGIKNYLVNHGNPALDQLLQIEKTKLGAHEFLNVDAILEGALLKCIVRPLRPLIYNAFVSFYDKNGSLKAVADGIRAARSKPLQELGIKAPLVPLKGRSLEAVMSHLRLMQKTYSPMKKLENLLAACSEIYNSMANCCGTTDDSEPSIDGGQLPAASAEDFLAMLLYVLVQCGTVSAEIEAEYMRGLLPPALICGDGGYYLTTLSSVVATIKNKGAAQLPTFQQASHATESPAAPSFLKVYIPDETTSSIVTRIIPVRPMMTARELCAMVAHKLLITNPQDYALYVVSNGKEIKKLLDAAPLASAAPMQPGYAIAFRRASAQIVWPSVLN